MPEPEPWQVPCNESGIASQPWQEPNEKYRDILGATAHGLLVGAELWGGIKQCVGSHHRPERQHARLLGVRGAGGW